VQLLELGSIGRFSFWPRCNSKEPPQFLCDSEILADASAFFYEDENVLESFLGYKTLIVNPKNTSLVMLPCCCVRQDAKTCYYYGNGSEKCCHHP
jgi:hypothetical protein